MECLILYFIFSAIVSIVILWNGNDNWFTIFLGIVFGFIIFPMALGTAINKINNNI